MMNGEGFDSSRIVLTAPSALPILVVSRLTTFTMLGSGQGFKFGGWMSCRLQQLMESYGFMSQGMLIKES